MKVSVQHHNPCLPSQVICELVNQVGMSWEAIPCKLSCWLHQGVPRHVAMPALKDAVFKPCGSPWICGGMQYSLL